MRVMVVSLSVIGVSCGDARPAAEIVRNRIASLAPSANIGHRGTGTTRAGHPFPENSLPSFAAAIAAGADGIELDVELTADGELVVMHDDTLDRTTDCAGCVSEWLLGDIHDCRLLDGEGRPTGEWPPTLGETFAVLPADALVNVELKVFGVGCRTATTGPEELAAAAAHEIRRLGVVGQTVFSSFSRAAIAALKAENSDLYAGYLYSVPEPDDAQWAVSMGLDAIHPAFVLVPQGDVDRALVAGLQVNMWTVNTTDQMNDVLDRGATAIITDEPGVLFAVIDARADSSD